MKKLLIFLMCLIMTSCGEPMENTYLIGFNDGTYIEIVADNCSYNEFCHTYNFKSSHGNQFIPRDNVKFIYIKRDGEFEELSK